MSSLFRYFILAAALTPSSLRADVFTNVPETVSEGYVVVYDLDIPVNGGFRDATPVPYLVDNRATAPSFDRIAYYLELNDGVSTEWVYASVDAFTASAAAIGVPHNVDNPVIQQRLVSNMNVLSNKAGITNGTGLTGGNIEIWSSNYFPQNDAAILGASATTHDFGDGGATLASGYGSFQVHNHTAGEVLMAWNRWGVADAPADDLGIGTRPSGEPDWTFAANAGGYVSRKLVILVRPLPYNVQFTAVPKDLQLYPRDTVSNTATVEVSGNELNGGYTEAVLRVYRNDIQVGGDMVQALSYGGGGAPFSFTPSITAELADYDLELFLRDGMGGEFSVRRAEDLVAGDVYMIQGQSNAEADAYGPPWETANIYQISHVRTYGLDSESAAATMNASSWAVADGDGSLGVPGGIGQWGLVLGYQLVVSNNVPVAILNGAKDGEPISYFQRNDGNPEDLATNYGRLLYRMRQAGLDDDVRAIFFYQGESDVNDGPVHESGYIDLRADWLVDYVSTGKFYVFQVREGCGVSRFDVDLRNRQRLLADQFPDVSVMSVTGIDPHDGCHFLFTNGYEEIGFNIARMAQRDLYGTAALPDTDPPNPAYAQLTGAGDDVVRIGLRNPGDAITFEPGAEADFAIEGAAVSVSSGSIVNGKIELQLSGSATGATAVKYTGHIGAGPWVTNANGVGLLSFIEPLVPDNFSMSFVTPSRSVAADVGVPLNLQADATSDPVNVVSKMELFVGINRIAVAVAADTISTTWTPPVAGAYRLTARTESVVGNIVSQEIFVFAEAESSPGGVGAGLQVWLRADKGMTTDAFGRVSAWADQSGSGNGVSQAVSAAQPEFVEGAFGCFPGVRFDGNDFLGSLTGMPLGSYTKVVRYKLLNLGANNNILSSGVNGAARHALAHDSAPYPLLYHGGTFATSSQGLSAGEEVVVSATYDAATNAGEIFIEGISTATGTAAFDNTTTTYQLGAYNSANYLNGVIGEAIIYDRVLTVNERQAVESYLADRCLTPYQVWQRDVPGATLPHGDGDGIAPEAEYAFGLNPLIADGSLPIWVDPQTPAAVYERPMGFDHVHYDVHLTTDFQLWAPLIGPAQILPSPGRPGYETVTILIPWPWTTFDRLYMRVCPVFE